VTQDIEAETDQGARSCFHPGEAEALASLRLKPDPRPDQVSARGHSGRLLLAQWTSPDTIGADELFCEAFSIPGIERSTRRWWGSRD
jgi:hypothetical protein